VIPTPSSWARLALVDVEGNGEGSLTGVGVAPPQPFRAKLASGTKMPDLSVSRPPTARSRLAGIDGDNSGQTSAAPGAGLQAPLF